MNLNNFSIKTKILTLVLSAVVGISAVAFGVMFFSSKSISSDMVNKFQETSNQSIENIVRNVYKSCQITDQLLTKILNIKLNDAKIIIKNKGGLSFSNDKQNWNCVNQVTKQVTEITLPKVNLGSNWIGSIKSFETYQPVVDDVAEKFYTCTIFQRMNEKGDMLRIATNVQLENGERAIGTYIPAINPDGSDSKIIKNVLDGIAYYGNAFVVNDYYQSVYEPIKDKSGKIIGMLYVGVSLNITSQLRESIISTTVGKTGYMYVLGGTGARKGHYIISKNGERDGENIWDAKDDNGELVIQKLTKQAVETPEGKITRIIYPWKNKGDAEAKEKVVALAYFKPFDWVIGAGTNLEELEESSIIIHNSFNKIYIYFILAVSISVIGIILTTFFVTNKIANPIKRAVNIMALISNGNINQANIESAKLEKDYHT